MELVSDIISFQQARQQVIVSQMDLIIRDIGRDKRDLCLQTKKGFMILTAN
ncbi:hypothetical protein IGI49_000062 [Enterococcus sp. AZ071]